MYKFLHAACASRRWLFGGLLCVAVLAGGDAAALTPQRFDTIEQAERMLSDLSTQISAAPDSAALYVERGELQRQMLAFQPALDDYQHALALEPENAKALLGAGIVLAHLGRLAEGQAVLGSYIERYPDSSEAYTKRGVRYLWMEDLPAAEKDLLKAIELNPGNAEACDDLGVVYARAGRYEAAIGLFLRTISLEPNYFKGHHNLAMAYYLAGQDALALMQTDKALALDHDARDTLLLKARILRILGREVEAAEIQQMAEFLPSPGAWGEYVPVR